MSARHGGPNAGNAALRTYVRTSPRRRRPFYAIATALLVATPAIAKDVIPAATPVGDPISCIEGDRYLKYTQVRSDQVIDFTTKSGKVYRNTLVTACPQLGFEQRFIHAVEGTEKYCATDAITVLIDSGRSRGATCGLGKFQEVKLADAK
jgi:hypothetical protein